MFTPKVYFCMNIPKFLYLFTWLISICIVSLFWLLLNLLMYIFRYFCRHIFICLGHLLKYELPGHTCLTLEELATASQNVVAPLHTSTKKSMMVPAAVFQQHLVLLDF